MRRDREEFAKELSERIEKVTKCFLFNPEERLKVHEELTEAANDERLLDAQAAVFITVETIFKVLEEYKIC